MGRFGPAARDMRLAIFGGTFDPIHNAHLAIGRRAADDVRLDRILFVPAAHPPHKAGVTHAGYEDRVAMVEIACQGEPRFEVSRLEEGTARSYSIDTIEKVRVRLRPGDELFFLIGADAFAEIRTWRRWQDVARDVCFIVVSRPGHIYDTPPGVRIERLESVELPVSSSEVRRALAMNEYTAAVPRGVLEYIMRHGLYVHPSDFGHL
jgi:nicotinate-nucleotide adenylyltransferase